MGESKGGGVREPVQFGRHLDPKTKECDFEKTFNEELGTLRGLGALLDDVAMAEAESESSRSGIRLSAESLWFIQGVMASTARRLREKIEAIHDQVCPIGTATTTRPPGPGPAQPAVVETGSKKKMSSGGKSKQTSAVRRELEVSGRPQPGGRSGGNGKGRRPVAAGI